MDCGVDFSLITLQIKCKTIKIPLFNSISNNIGARKISAANCVAVGDVISCCQVLVMFFIFVGFFDRGFIDFVARIGICYVKLVISNLFASW